MTAIDCITCPTSPQAWSKHEASAASGIALQVEDLARLSFKRKPVYVGVDDQRQEATREGLEQGYCVVPSEQRFLLLFTFLKRNANKKVAATPPCLTCDGPVLHCCCPCCRGVPHEVSWLHRASKAVLAAVTCQRQEH